MLSKILPIGSLFLIFAIAVYLWFSGILSDVLIAHVYVAEVTEQVADGHFLTDRDIRIKEIEKSKAKEKSLLFEKDASSKDVVRKLAGRPTKKALTKGTVLEDSMFGDPTGMITLVTTRDVKKGDPISLKNVRTEEVLGTFDDGAMLFSSEQNALEYFDGHADLTFSEDVGRGKAVTFENILKGSEKVFAIAVVRRIFKNQVLSDGNLMIREIPNNQLEDGSISFADRNSAKRYILGISQFMATRELPINEVLTADAIMYRNEKALEMSEEMPTTFDELEGFAKKYVDQVIILDKTMMMSGNLEKDNLVDLWVEESRTHTKESMFGEINFRRVSHNALVHVVGEIKGGVPETTNDHLGYWILVDPDEYKAFNDAWIDRSKIAFAMNTKESLSDAIGNGASCIDETCSVNRNVTDDMSELLERFNPSFDENAGEEADHLTILESVGPDLAKALREKEFKSLEDVARITDLQISQLSIQLHISRNRVVMIRDQAKQIVASKREARSKMLKQ